MAKISPVMVRVCLIVVNLSLLMVHCVYQWTLYKTHYLEKIFEANATCTFNRLHTSRYSDTIPKHYNVEVWCHYTLKCEDDEDLVFGEMLLLTISNVLSDFLGRTEVRVNDILTESRTRRGPITKRLLLHEVSSGEVVVKLDLQLYDNTWRHHMTTTAERRGKSKSCWTSARTKYKTGN